ncbi:hypothetical protein HYU11_04875 [Candidatus Woesearchaeota archaeon]|nr:hypothetical protein [Candidatus Woesearchaeota archaeon]
MRKRNMCTRCGSFIVKTSQSDPYLCRWCGMEGDANDIYSRLDSKFF